MKLLHYYPQNSNPIKIYVEFFVSFTILVQLSNIAVTS